MPPPDLHTRSQFSGLEERRKPPIERTYSELGALKHGEIGEGVCLASVQAVEDLDELVGRWVGVEQGGEEDQGEEEDVESDDEDEEEDDEDEDDDDDEFHSAKSRSVTPSLPSTPRTPSEGPLRRLSISIPPHELSPEFPTASLLRTLTASASSLTHLHITYTEPLLAHDPRLPSALAALPALTHLVLSEVGPVGSEVLRSLSSRLEEVEVNFDDTWVAAVLAGPTGSGTHALTLVPQLPNGESSGLPTPAPTPATTPAPAYAAGTILPDPIPLLAHSMATLRTLRASNAVIVTVADKLRYPAVRTLALRLAGVPTVTPLVHAFPNVADVYVYTPFDGCGLRPVPSPSPESSASSSQTQTQTGTKGKGKQRCGNRPKRMPTMDATREANRTSQLYSSFSPLGRVRGFAPGLYAFGLSCAIRALEVGALSADEAPLVRKVLADTRPGTVSLGLGRGWWEGKERTRGREREADGLGTLFASGEEVADHGAAGVSELVVRVEEPGRWADVTSDLLAMLLPLANSLSVFVLHWDRTSVPFDRISPEDEEDEDGDAQDPSATDGTSRTERLARRIAQQMPLLRYVFLELVHDGSVPSPPPPSNSNRALTADSRSSSRPTAAGGVRRHERQCWRVDRSQGWLCLDKLADADVSRVVEAEGLSFEDRVRY